MKSGAYKCQPVPGWCRHKQARRTHQCMRVKLKPHTVVTARQLHQPSLGTSEAICDAGAVLSADACSCSHLRCGAHMRQCNDPRVAVQRIIHGVLRRLLPVHIQPYLCIMAIVRRP